MMAEKYTIAIVEDDSGIRDLVVDILTRDGYETRAFGSVEDFHRKCEIPLIDCLILDLMLPGQDGLSLCRQLRISIPRLPILMVTAKGDEIDRIVGLEMGADDYLAKPFSSRELLARLRAVLRRTHEAIGVADRSDCELYRFNGWTLSIGARDLIDPEGRSVVLTTSEFDLLHILVTCPQRVLSRELLIDRTRGRGANPNDRVIDVQLSRLRRKLGEDPREPAMIRTVRGDGYLFAPVVLKV
ncbi:response regulator [Sphingomonas sp. YL-JM2C]